MDDEIKRASLESLVPEDLENHLIFNSNRLRTFRDARSEIVTYVEEKFGSRLRNRAKENGHQIRAMGVSRVMQHIFNETAIQASNSANKRRAKAIRASHGP